MHGTDDQDPRRYDDIIDLPRHVSARHRPMAMQDRAAQFSPFAALTGYGGQTPAGYPFCAILLLDPPGDGDAARLEQALNRLDGVRARVEPGGRRAVVYTRRPPDRRLLTRAAEDARCRVVRYTRTA